jgi:hypothetical protein
MIGGSPIAIAHYQGSGGWDAVASGPQVVYCCLGPLALTAAGPEFSLLHGRLGQTLAGLSIGYGFDRDATNPDDKETDPQAVDSWLKVGEGPEKPSANSFHETAFEEVSTAFGTHRDRVSLLFGVSGGLPLYARRWAALAFEGSSDLGYLRNADAKYAAYRAGAGARFHVRRVPILSLFSLIVMPIQVEGALGWRWRTDGWFTGQTGLAITIDRLELRVSSPRYVWRSRAWFNNEVAEIAAATKF